MRDDEYQENLIQIGHIRQNSNNLGKLPHYAQSKQYYPNNQTEF